MNRYLFAILLIFLLALLVGGKSLAVEPNRTITLVFTSNVYGEIEPCG